jgi:hypothetical protein
MHVMRDDDDSAEQEEREKHEVPTVPPRAGEENVYESETMIGSLTPELLALLRQQDEQPIDVGTGEEANVPVFVMDDAPPAPASPAEIPRRTPVLAPVKDETSSPPDRISSFLTPRPGRVDSDAPMLAFPGVARVPRDAAPVTARPLAPPPVAVQPAVIVSDPAELAPVLDEAAFPAPSKPASAPPASPAPALQDELAPAPVDAAFAPAPEVYEPLFAPLPVSAEAAPTKAPRMPVGLVWAIVVVGAFAIGVLALVLTR